MGADIGTCWSGKKATTERLIGEDMVVVVDDVNGKRGSDTDLASYWTWRRSPELAFELRYRIGCRNRQLSNKLSLPTCLLVCLLIPICTLTPNRSHH